MVEFVTNNAKDFEDCFLDMVIIDLLLIRRLKYKLKRMRLKIIKF